MNRIWGKGSACRRNTPGLDTQLHHSAAAHKRGDNARPWHPVHSRRRGSPGIPVIDVCPTIEVYRGLWNWIYLPIESINEVSPVSMDWFKANFTGNPISSGKNTMVSGYCFPINQSIDNNNPSPIETSWKFIKLGIPLATGWWKDPQPWIVFMWWSIALGLPQYLIDSYRIMVLWL